MGQFFVLDVKMLEDGMKVKLKIGLWNCMNGV